MWEAANLPPGVLQRSLQTCAGYFVKDTLSSALTHRELRTQLESLAKPRLT